MFTDEVRRKSWTFNFPVPGRKQNWQMTYTLDLNMYFHGHILLYPVLTLDYDRVVDKLLMAESAETKDYLRDELLIAVRASIPEVVDFSEDYTVIRNNNLP